MSQPSSVHLDANDAKAKYNVGQLYIDGKNKKAYVYVHVNANSAAVASGTPLLQLSGTVGDVTTVYSAANAAMPAGFGQNTISAGNYGWIQTWGNIASVLKGYSDSTSVVNTGDIITYSAYDAKVVGNAITVAVNNGMGRATVSTTGQATTIGNVEANCNKYWPAD